MDSTAHRRIGAHILLQVVSEMDQSDTLPGMVSRHRKVGMLLLPLSVLTSPQISTSFRDTCLQNIFQMCLQVLQRISQSKDIVRQHMLKVVLYHVSWQDLDYVALLLQVTRACLNYDFIGSNTDESADDFRTLQVPNGAIVHHSVKSTSILSCSLEGLSHRAADTPPLLCHLSQHRAARLRFRAHFSALICQEKI